MSGVPHRGPRGITCESGTFGTQGDSVPDSVESLVEVECVSIFSSCAVWGFFQGVHVDLEFSADACSKNFLLGKSR